MMKLKNILFLFLFLGFISPFRLHADSLSWDTTRIPLKWKKESVVILKYDYSFNYDFSSYSGYSKTMLRIVYYVRDKWGVEILSRIHLPPGAEPAISDRVGVVHKRDGTQLEITKDQLIPSKESVNFNNASGRTGVSIESEIDQKLAVPSLEVGDVLELHVAIPKTRAPEYILLINKFPMLRYNAKVSVIPNPNSFSSIQIEAVYINTDIKGPDFASSDLVIELENVDKYTNEILSDIRKDLPYALIRFKVTGSVGKKEDFSDVPFMIKSSKQDVHLYMARQIYPKRHRGEKRVAKKILSALKNKYPAVKDTLEYVKAAYYMYREVVAGENLFNGYDSYKYQNDRFYANALSRVLFKKKIKYKIFLTQPDHYVLPATYENFIEPHFGITLPGHDLYLFNPLYSYEPGNIPSYFEGQRFYSFSANKYYKKTKYFWYFWAFPIIPLNFVTGAATLPITLPLYAIQGATAKSNRKYDFAEGQFPTVKFDANRIVQDIKVTKIDLKENILSCESLTSCYGKMKINESARICAASGNFILKNNNEYRKMALKTDKELPVTEFDTINLTKHMRSIAEYDLNRSGYVLKKVNSHKVVESNLFDASRPFIYSVSYEAKNMVSSFDDYMVFNAGSLIGRQLILPEDTSERKHKFYTPYQKHLVNKISINVPEGYAVENLLDFNVKEESSAGYFTSETSVSGSTIMITTNKVYNFKWVDRKDANIVYPFFRAAEKFYDKKMIFRKISAGK